VCGACKAGAHRPRPAITVRAFLQSTCFSCTSLINYDMTVAFKSNCFIHTTTMIVTHRPVLLEEDEDSIAQTLCRYNRGVANDKPPTPHIPHIKMMRDLICTADGRSRWLSCATTTTGRASKQAGRWLHHSPTLQPWESRAGSHGDVALCLN